MSHYICKFAALVVGIMVMASCGGASGLTEASGTNDSGTEEVATRSVIGTLSSPDAAAAMKMAVPGCYADTVMATDTTGASTLAGVAEDCAFAIELVVGKSYVISFLNDDQFIATLIFYSGISGDTTTWLPVSGSGILDLGTITLQGSVAIPEINPLEECDQDDDGENDLEDTDDDNDEVIDDLEMDCDLDGVIDDFDEDNADCDTAGEEDDTENEDSEDNSDQEDSGDETGEGTDEGEDNGDEDGDDEPILEYAYVLQVKPHNDPHGRRSVDLDKDVKARVGCEVDPATVNDATFIVGSVDGYDTIVCEYDVHSHPNCDSRLICEHEDQEFLPSTMYYAYVDGALCTDGRPVAATYWEWWTEETNTSVGCFEDDYEIQLESI